MKANVQFYGIRCYQFSPFTYLLTSLKILRNSKCSNKYCFKIIVTVNPFSTKSRFLTPLQQMTFKNTGHKVKLLMICDVNFYHNVFNFLHSIILSCAEIFQLLVKIVKKLSTADLLMNLFHFCRDTILQYSVLIFVEGERWG